MPPQAQKVPLMVALTTARTTDTLGASFGPALTVLAWVWPASGKCRGRSEEAGEASIDIALPALRSSQPMLSMCSEVRGADA